MGHGVRVRFGVRLGDFVKKRKLMVNITYRNNNEYQILKMQKNLLISRA